MILLHHDSVRYVHGLSKLEERQLCARSGHLTSYSDLYFDEQVADHFEPSCVSINLKISFTDSLSGWLNSLK